MIGSSLEDFVDGEDLSLSSFGFELSTQVVPEFGLGDDFIACEESNSIDFGIRVLFSGQLASKDKVLSDLSDMKRYTFIWREGSAGS